MQSLYEYYFGPETERNRGLGDAVQVVNASSGPVMIPRERGVMVPAGTTATLNLSRVERAELVVARLSRRIYVTDGSGIVPESKVKLVPVINDSGIPIQIIQVGSDGRRWPQRVGGKNLGCGQDIITPRSSLGFVPMVKGARWQVVHPSEEFMVLSNLVVPDLATVTALRYDGSTLGVN